MKKLLLFAIILVVLVFAFRALIFDGDQDDMSDVTAQVTKDIEGEGTETLAQKSDELQEQALGIIASAEEQYDALVDKIDDISDDDKREKLQEQIDAARRMLDKAQEELDTSLFTDAIESANDALQRTKDAMKKLQSETEQNTKDVAENLENEFDDALDKRQELRLKYAQTIQQIEQLTLERSQSTDKDTYTQKIERLVRQLDDIRFELNLIEASTDYYDTKLELEDDRDDIYEKIRKKEEDISESETKMDETYQKIEEMGSDNAYLDKDYEDIIKVVDKKEKLWDDIDRLRDKIKEDEDDIADLREELYPIEEQLDIVRDILALKEKLAELQNDVAEIENLIEEYNDDYNSALDKDERRAIGKKIDPLEEELEDIIDEKDKLSEYIENLEKEID
jgi:hypothetical protein